MGLAAACRCQHGGGWKLRLGAPVSLGRWLGPRTLTQALRCGFSENSTHSGLLYVTQAWALLFLQGDSSESSCRASPDPASTETLVCVTHECFSTYCVPGLGCAHERQWESCPVATPRGSHCVLGVMMTILHEEKPQRVPSWAESLSKASWRRGMPGQGQKEGGATAARAQGLRRMRRQQMSLGGSLRFIKYLHRQILLGTLSWVLLAPADGWLLVLSEEEAQGHLL